MVCLNSEFELEVLIYQSVVCENSRYEVEDDEFQLGPLIYKNFNLIPGA